MIGNKQKIKIDITGHSLIGTDDDYPIDWGNYFWINDYRVVNFWMENLKELMDRNIIDDEIDVILYEDDRFCLIFDERIPQEWYYKKVCTTGYKTPSKEIAEEMYFLMGGDAFNELEFYDDPKSYYAKRGGRLSDDGNLVIYERKALKENK